MPPLSSCRSNTDIRYYSVGDGCKIWLKFLLCRAKKKIKNCAVLNQIFTLRNTQMN